MDPETRSKKKDPETRSKKKDPDRGRDEDGETEGETETERPRQRWRRRDRGRDSVVPTAAELPLRVAVLPRDGGEGGRVQEDGGDAALASWWTDLGVPGCGCDRGNGVREREFEREIELRTERE